MDKFNSVKFVAEICKSRKIAISRLEKDCGFSNGYIKSVLEKGTFPSDRLQIIADYLNVPIKYLLTGKDEGDVPKPFDSKEQEMIKYFQDLSDTQKDIILSTMEQFSIQKKAIDFAKNHEDYSEKDFALPEKNKADKYYNTLYKYTKPFPTLPVMFKDEYFKTIDMLNDICDIPYGINEKIDFLKDNLKKIIKLLSHAIVYGDSIVNTNGEYEYSFIDSKEKLSSLSKKVESENNVPDNKENASLENFEQELLECLEYIDSKIDHNSNNNSVLLSKKQYKKSLDLINQARKYKKGENKLIDLIDQKYYYILDGFEMFVSYESNFFDDETNQN